jgi:hypothetical protein
MSQKVRPSILYQPFQFQLSTCSLLSTRVILRSSQDHPTDHSEIILQIILRSSHDHPQINLHSGSGVPKSSLAVTPPSRGLLVACQLHTKNGKSSVPSSGVSSTIDCQPCRCDEGLFCRRPDEPRLAKISRKFHSTRLDSTDEVLVLQDAAPTRS